MKLEEREDGACRVAMARIDGTAFVGPWEMSKELAIAKAKEALITLCQLVRVMKVPQ
jgi:hypothetical protein